MIKNIKDLPLPVLTEVNAEIERRTKVMSKYNISDSKKLAWNLEFKTGVLFIYNLINKL